jgi:hypothetical protein
MDENSLRLHELAAQFLFNELRLMSERTNFFLTTNSILVAGFLIAADVRLFYVRLALAILGMVSCFLQASTARAASRAAHFWRAYMRAIEENDPTFQAFKERSLSPLVERNKFYSRKSELPKQSSDWGYDRLNEMSWWDVKVTMGKLSPARVTWFVFPTVFLAFWVFSVLWLVLIAN